MFIETKLYSNVSIFSQLFESLCVRIHFLLNNSPSRIILLGLYIIIVTWLMIILVVLENVALQLFETSCAYSFEY